MKTYFVAGTGTHVGKTLVTCALAAQLKTKGKRVRALKPLISGFDPAHPESSDTAELLAAQGMPCTPKNIAALSPWRFAAPLSPDMAAEDEGRTIPLKAVVAFCQSTKDVDCLLIESAGGIMTPLAKGHTMLDWAAALGAPIILVTGSYLGSMSHTLTACHAIRTAALALQAVVVSESESPATDNARLHPTLEPFLPKGTPLSFIRRLDSSGPVWKNAPDLTALIA